MGGEATSPTASHCDLRKRVAVPLWASVTPAVPGEGWGAKPRKPCPFKHPIMGGHPTPNCSWQVPVHSARADWMLTSLGSCLSFRHHVLTPPLTTLNFCAPLSSLGVSAVAELLPGALAWLPPSRFSVQRPRSLSPSLPAAGAAAPTTPHSLTISQPSLFSSVFIAA